MYIFELIYKLRHKKKETMPEFEPDIEEEYKNCEHVFVPVDSTKKVLACIKCGVLKKQKQ